MLLYDVQIVFVDNVKIEEMLLVDIVKEEFFIVCGGLKEMVLFEFVYLFNWFQFKVVVVVIQIVIVKNFVIWGEDYK